MTSVIVYYCYLIYKVIEKFSKSELSNIIMPLKTHRN